MKKNLPLEKTSEFCPLCGLIADHYFCAPQTAKELEAPEKGGGEAEVMICGIKLEDW